jgi:hypothetical protein
VQTLDLFARDGRLEGKVELLERLDRGQARGSHRGLKPAVIAQGDLRPEHSLQRFTGGDGAAIDIGQDLVNRFQCAGEFKIRQHLADMISSCGGAHRTASA